MNALCCQHRSGPDLNRLYQACGAQRYAIRLPGCYPSTPPLRCWPPLLSRGGQGSADQVRCLLDAVCLDYSSTRGLSPSHCRLVLRQHRSGPDLNRLYQACGAQRYAIRLPGCYPSTPPLRCWPPLLSRGGQGSADQVRCLLDAVCLDYSSTRGLSPSRCWLVLRQHRSGPGLIPASHLRLRDLRNQALPGGVGLHDITGVC